MSESEPPVPDAVVSEDKREIENEEREKMLNEENKSSDAAALVAAVMDEAASSTPPPVPDTPLPEDDAPATSATDTKEETKEGGEEDKEKEGEKKESKKRGLPNINIKMPSFLRGKSRERNKDGDTAAAEESKDLLQGGGSPEHGASSPTSGDVPSAPVKENESVRSKISGVFEKVKLPSNPFKKNKGVEAVELEEPKEGDDTPVVEKEKELAAAEGETEDIECGVETGASEKPVPVSRRTRLLEAIRAPLAAVWPRKSKLAPTEKDAEAGEAETEATDEKCVKDDKGADVEDGLETVKLEPQDQEEPEKTADLQESESLLFERIRSTFHQNKWFLIGSAVFLILLFVIIGLAISGPRYPRFTEMLVDGRYINAVTSCGIVQGLLDEGEYVFHGIPYARPPVGDRRFTPAEPLHKLEACWNNTYKAWHNESESGPSQCWHFLRNGSFAGNEDCLTLDVYTRKVRYDAPLPVVFLVSTETLAGGRSWRPARGMARQRDVVFVQPRFRLGAFGFLATAALSRTAYPPRSGNYALSDLLAALEWVRINIEHFGGDPSSVTIVGHRGGSSLVAALTALPKRRGAITNRPFKQVWLSSGSGLLPIHSLSQAEAHGQELMSALGCDNPVCARRVEPEDIMAATPEDWKPRFVTDLPHTLPAADAHRWLIQDGELIQQDLYKTWEEHGLNYRIVVGTTAHVEASPELYTRKDWTQLANFVNHVRGSVLGSQNVAQGLGNEVLARYKPPSWPMLAAMISDMRTVCPLYETARHIATTAAANERVAKHSSSVHFYVAIQPRNSTSGPVADVGSDIETILGLYEAQSPEQKRYLSAMQNLFYRFVWHGDLPTGITGSEKSTALPQHVLVVGQDVAVQPTYQNCDFWIQRQLASVYGRAD